MSKRTRLVTCLISFCLAALLPVNPVWAGDEDLNTAVYLVFDPETGEFITVEEQSGARRNHDSQAAPSTQGAQHPTVASPQILQFPLLAGSVLALGLLGGAVVWLRKSRRQPAP